MTKEKAYEIIKERGFGYTEDEFLEALSVVEEAFGFVREVSYDGSDLTVATGSGNEVDYTVKIINKEIDYAVGEKI